ncbi:hypothetical protein ACQEVZ_49500 [Dactylosporangium sp. CA-152071]|uniref:hypothetical protein n=1 Tax=Dactylosporangium sp. CA-152071 TaxID=3239933 RepID=UPI003D8DBA78
MTGPWKTTCAASRPAAWSCTTDSSSWSRRAGDRGQLDDAFAGWVAEAYEVGQGGHLTR